MRVWLWATLRTLFPIAVCMVLLLAGSSGAVDLPVDANKLVIRGGAAGPKVVLRSRDPSFGFPTLGSADDPRSVGATLDLFSLGGGQAGFALPAEGWTASGGARERYRFVNREAPAGISAVKAVVLKRDKGVKLTTRAAGVNTEVAQQTVGVRLTMGTTRSCTVFAPPTIRRDDPGKFIGLRAGASSTPDCDASNLDAASGCRFGEPYECSGSCAQGSQCGASIPDGECQCFSDDSPCGDTAPVCNGACSTGEECATVNVSPFPYCQCVLVGATPCGNSAFPTCDGVCPTGSTCGPIQSQYGNECSCHPVGAVCGGPDCVGACAPGAACAILPGFTDCVCNMVQ